MSEHKAVGSLFISKQTGRILLNLRSDKTSKGGLWSIFGGMIEKDETVQAALKRELIEEMGFVPDFIKAYPLDVYISLDGKFNYYTILIIVEDEFIPKINRESDGYAWCKLGKYPKPLHQAVRKLLSNKSVVQNIKKALLSAS